MKSILLTTFLAAALGVSVSAMALDAPGIAPSVSDRHIAGGDVVRQVSAEPRLLAAGDAWEENWKRLNLPERRKVRTAIPQRADGEHPYTR